MSLQSRIISQTQDKLPHAPSIGTKGPWDAHATRCHAAPCHTARLRSVCDVKRFRNRADANANPHPSELKLTVP